MQIDCYCAATDAKGNIAADIVGNCVIDEHEGRVDLSTLPQCSALALVSVNQSFGRNISLVQ